MPALPQKRGRHLVFFSPAVANVILSFVFRLSSFSFLNYSFMRPRIFSLSTTSRGEPPPRTSHFSKLATLIL